ncbi:MULTISPECIES: SLBB domain-containing protein [Acidobacteriaceae]|uniref:SLBB domain-containing protein n=1 Tax=Acidobacteriaceae TaxID=204434 RepID=UPI0020B1408C|nr:MULTISPECIES: SLBB domain-containing protein [Acidobacteriaceae]MDW5265155.1 SLBB domain-containing protein [Edaphobacter sp.]
MPQTSLSADQIINILQRSPDLVVELKSELADRMQQQGVQIDPNDISDQTLYSQISSNANLRASITSVLRARGYVSDGDLQSMGSSVPEEDSPRHLSSTGSSLSRGDDAVEAGAGTSERSPGFGENDNSASAGPFMRPDHSRQSAEGSPRRQEKVNASTDSPKVFRRPSPYDLQSMRDLYTQIPNETAQLRRFGSEVFINHDGSAVAIGISSQNTPLDVPLGPDYIVGAGDTLTINLWGGVTQNITRTVDRDGHIFLPEAGSIQLAGLSLGTAQSLIGSELKQQFRNAQVSVTVSRLRSVRVYVVGDVQQPGGYDISALATPLSALYAAGGPTSIGSLRTLLHYRGKQLVEKVDLYDFLLHGIRNGSAPFESGDTLLVPPAGPQIAIFGAIKRPAIYELKAGETTLASVVEDAGGFTAAASLSHIRIERIDAHHQRVTVTLPDHDTQSPQAAGGAIDNFQVEDGDRIRIEPILSYSQRAIYLAGHVVRPGRLPYSDGMHLSDVLRSYQDMLPEPAAHGELVRLVPPDLHAETIDFNVPDVLIGNANIDLHPFDTIRIFGRYEVDAPKVTIRGEVLRPGTYPMSKGMTAAGLVRMAGGFKRDALLESADLTSYEVSNGNRLVEDLATVKIGAAVTGSDAQADVPLKPGDILAIHQITSWNDMGESVTISGQVRFPGSYGFTDGEHLSSVLRRVGGLLPTAYPIGAVFTRVQVRELEQKSREELIRQIETNSAAARLSPGLAGSNAGGELQLIKAQQEQVLSDLKSRPPMGRMVIHVTPDIDSWANTPADIELRRGDILTIPKRPGFVLITGQVYNATALTYAPDKTAGWYLSRAGGTNATANRKEIFIIRANGSVVGRHSGGWFDADVLSTKLNPGDVVVVPQKILGGSLFWKTLLSTGQLAASVAITAAVAAAAL